MKHDTWPFVGLIAALSVAAAALVTCGTARAQEAGMVDTLSTDAGNGARITLYRKETGNCPAPMKRAEFIPASGARVEGCWALGKSAEGALFVLIEWADGDKDAVPVGEFVKPQTGV